MNSFKVFIKTLTGVSFPITCTRNDTIENLKEKVEESKNIPMDEQRMIHSGRGLEDRRTVGDYNITRMSTIHLVLRLRCFCWKLKMKIIQKEGIKATEGWEEEYKKKVLSDFDFEEDPVTTGVRGHKRRLFSEIRDCYKRRHKNMVSLKCVSSPQNFLEWDLILSGPKDSPYEGGEFTFRVVFYKDHPFRPFQISFMTRMFHPWFVGIGKIGSICRDRGGFITASSIRACGIIPRDEWSPAIKLEDILHSMVENMQKVVEIYKNQKYKPEFPKESKALQLLKEGKFGEFVRIAKLWTSWFSGGANKIRVPIDIVDEKERVEFLLLSCLQNSTSFLEEKNKFEITTISSTICLTKFFFFL